MEINAYTNAKQLMGKAMFDTNYPFRVMIHQELTEYERDSMKNNTATEETLAKVQKVIGQYLEETRPLTFEERFKLQQEQHKKDRIFTIDREIGLLEKQLSKLDDMADRDMPLPYGQRQKLRAEISKLRTELETLQPKKETIQPVSEGVQKIASELGFDVDAFMTNFTNNADNQ